jgi:hypothetical protein
MRVEAQRRHAEPRIQWLDDACRTERHQRHEDATELGRLAIQRENRRVLDLQTSAFGASTAGGLFLSSGSHG